MKSSLKKIYLLIVVLTLFFVAGVQSQSVTVYDSFSQLESRLKTSGDTLLLINFWATWCKPCVKELPYFQSLDEKFKDKKIRILFVSLDFKMQLDTAVIPFIKNRNMKQEVVLLADADQNAWISKVDNEWDGAIPATLLVSGNKKFFHREEFESEADLEQWIERAIKINL